MLDSEKAPDPVSASFGFEQYKDIDSRRDAFAGVIQNEDDPVKSPFYKWDYIKQSPVSESLAEQGMIPSDREMGTRVGRRRVGPDTSVTCVFCRSKFSVRDNMNPLAQHLTQSVEENVKSCHFASTFMDAYPADRNPFYEHNMPADDPRIGMEHNAEAPGATAVSEVVGATGFSRLHSFGGCGESFPAGCSRLTHGFPVDGYHDEQTQASRELERNIFDFFRERTACNGADCRKFSRCIIDAGPEQQAVAQLITFIGKLARRGDKALQQREAMEKVFEACEHDRSLVADICALAGTIGDGCDDRRTEVLERMIVRCALHNLYQLPEEQTIYWSDFLTVLKKQFHEEIFDKTFNHFRYGFSNKSTLIENKESAEIRGFYKHLLSHGCAFSSEMLGLSHPGYKCPNSDIYYEFQKVFFEGIVDSNAFYDFVERTIKQDYDKAFEFICLHDEAFNSLIQKLDSQYEQEMDDIEDLKGIIEDQGYNRGLIDLQNKRETESLRVLCEFLKERVRKNWDAIQQNTVSGEIKAGLTFEQLRRIVMRIDSVTNILQPWIQPLSQEEVFELERIAGL